MATFSDLPPELVDRILSNLSAADVCKARVSTATNQVFKDSYPALQFLLQIPNDPRMTIAPDEVLGMSREDAEYIKSVSLRSLFQSLQRVDYQYYTIRDMPESHIDYAYRIINHLFPHTPTGDRTTVGSPYDVYSMPSSMADSGHRNVSEEGLRGLLKLRAILMSGFRPSHNHAHTGRYISPTGYKKFAHMTASFPAPGGYGHNIVIFCIDSMFRMWGVMRNTTKFYIGIRDTGFMMDVDGSAHVTGLWKDRFEPELSLFNADPVATMSRWSGRGHACVFCGRYLTNPFDWEKGSGSWCWRRYSKGLNAVTGRRTVVRTPMVEVDI
eukprot:jgi/Mesvir1/18589/Mv17098-RA.1